MSYLGHAYITDRIAAIDGQTSYAHLVSLLKEACAVISGRDAALAMMWHKIETAPRDGTHILVCDASNPNQPPTTAHWFDGGWHLSVNYDGERSDHGMRSLTHWTSLQLLPKN